MELNTGENTGKETQKENINEPTDSGSEQANEVRFKKFFENRIEREWLSTEEAACFLSVSSNAIRIMVYRGQVPAYKFGRRLRFKVKDCRALFLKKGA